MFKVQGTGSTGAENLVHIKHPRPEPQRPGSGLGFQANVIQTSEVVPSSLATW